MPARMDLDTVFAISKFFVTIPAASPYLVLLALIIASSIVLFQFSIHYCNSNSVQRKHKAVTCVTYLNFISDITGPNISSCAISMEIFDNMMVSCLVFPKKADSNIQYSFLEITFTLTSEKIVGSILYSLTNDECKGQKDHQQPKLLLSLPTSSQIHHISLPEQTHVNLQHISHPEIKTRTKC
ncbi:hypothetical protein Ahy_A05g023118 isoform B [Arachis hypogaea]|nr:hypothetical protein Ahy_A05g023118 isoform B [Arachis hypogaea]